MPTKTRPVVKVKAGPEEGLDEGQFEAMVSVFGTVDSDGDRVVKGAFTKTLGAWDESGHPMPVIFSHDHQNPFAHIGYVLDAKETDDGLLVKGQLDIDGPDDKLARKAYQLLKGGRIRNWSYAYDVIDSKEADDGANELLEIGLHEVGPTLVGSNRDTETLAIKHDPATLKAAAQLNAVLEHNPALIDELKSYLKAGRVLSSKNEQKIRDAITSLQDVLATLGEVTAQEQASGASPAKDEAPEGKSSKPSPRPSARVLAAQRQLALGGA